MNVLACAALIAAIATPATVSALMDEAGLPPKDGETVTDQVARYLTVTRANKYADVVVMCVKVVPHAELTGERVTGILTAGFPNLRCGKRHGPHYLSLARTGKLTGAPIDIPKARRAGKGGAATLIEPTGAAAAAQAIVEAATTPPAEELTVAGLEALGRPEVLRVALRYGVAPKGKTTDLIAAIMAKASEPAVEQPSA